MSDVLVHLSARASLPSRRLAALCRMLKLFGTPDGFATLAFPSEQSREQTIRRVRDRLEDLGLDPHSFAFELSPETANCVLRYKPKSEHRAPAAVASNAAMVNSAPAARAMREPPPREPMPPSMVRSDEVGEGDFHLRLEGSELEERVDMTLIRLEWRVLEGRFEGRVFRDRVKALPENDRAIYFARAVGVSDNRLIEELPRRREVVVFVERRFNLQPDGSTKPVNHYYPPIEG